MAEAVIAIDMGDETLTNQDAFTGWFNERGYNVEEDSISNDDESIGYSIYERVGVVIYRFNNEGDYFPDIIVDFLADLEDRDNTGVSIAEEGEYGYETILEINLGDFIENVVNVENEEYSEAVEEDANEGDE